MSLPTTQRRILLLAELLQRRSGQAPTWAELRTRLGIPPDEFIGRMWGLKRDGYVTFTRKPRSLQVTEKGLRAAVNGKRP